MRANLQWKGEEKIMGKTISFVKGKGSLNHNNREFLASNIDESRVYLNEIYIRKTLEEAYEEIFGKEVAEYNSKQKRSDRKIDNYLNKIKNSGNNEKTFYEIVVQVGKKDDTGVLDENGNVTQSALQAKEVLDDYVKTFQERNPNLILFNAVLHMDEATPHLHLDYIPVAHGYKTGLKTRNSLTKGLQEMGISPAVSKTDNETVHWQERERKYLSDLCREHNIEIEILGVKRDDYTIPEYKIAMREKENAEAEVEILKAEKIEIEESIANAGDELELETIKIEEQKEILKDIDNQIYEKEKIIEAKEKMLDRILDSGKPVEKEIKEIRDQAVDVPHLFGGEPMVKLPKKTFDKMIIRYRVSGTFENLNQKYADELFSMKKTINKQNEIIKTLKTKVKQFEGFLDSHGLLKTFEEFLKLKSIIKKLDVNKKEIKEEKQKNKQKEKLFSRSNKNDIAI